MARYAFYAPWVVFALLGLPLPPQSEEAHLLPMAAEFPTIIGHRSRVLFRAPAEWQEAFRKLHPYEKGDSKFRAEEEGMDARMADFIRAREWHSFHEGRLLPNGARFVARRDASGEYLLLCVRTF